MERYRYRPPDAEYPYHWLDARAIKVRQDGRVVNMAAVVAIGVKACGERKGLSSDVGEAETDEFWQVFLRGLVAWGLRGVRCAISDAHEALKRSIADVLTGRVGSVAASTSCETTRPGP
ncbi:MAG: transposase [Hydrogenibacillus schlegelii]|nr:transposase [Hydrogenibacillus schlegelii]